MCDLAVPAGERGAHVGADDAADADGEGPLEHDHAFRAGQRGMQLVEREGAEGLQREQRRRRALLAQLVDDLLRACPITDPSATTTVSASSQR